MAEAATILAVLAALALTAGLVLARKLPFQIIGAILRALTFPIRIVFRVIGRGGRGQGAQAEIGPTAWAATARIFRGRTDTETALGDDFEHERAHITPRGLLFHWMSVRVGFMRMPEELDDELAAEYAGLAEKFLNAPVPMSADPRSLFEDVEGAVIAQQFFDSDRGLLFLLNESRKMINGNVRKLAVWFSAILSAVLIVNLLYNDGSVFDFHAMLGLSADSRFGAEAINSLGFGLLTCLAGAIAMWALYFTEYAPFQRNNTREMANYLTRYMARLNDHYRTAVGRAKSVTVGEERDSKQLSAAAQLWHANMIWLALRVFFVETYVRNVVYQISRNSSYYLIFVPAFFILALLAAGAALSAAGLWAPFAAIAELGWVFAALFVLVGALYVLFLSNSMGCLDEIDQGEWISFHTLRLNAMVGDVIGKYAEDVGYWKNRVSASGL
ncbi:hypothetical protein DDZ18_02175 [Marinicauda salina]|uniref:Uncharacterized protein n=1 Tax=Marinicauda salina TaxID=2135793 RepID=A0A2U2BWP1_9PROT|nr:hypothetical protein [Marinicauda salina]PWE18435.1 hypothetical protein DDZ18_02175 [Marinicauda salina]